MITVVGSLNLDLVARVRRLPESGETVLAEAYGEHEGGKGANQAVAAARLGRTPVAMIGWVGRDDAANRLNVSLQESGVNTAALVPVDAPTGRALIEVDAGGRNRIVVVAGANAYGEVGDLQALPHDPGGWLLLQREVPERINREAIRLARERGLRVALNPAPSEGLEDAGWHGVDLCMANEHEAAQLLGLPVSEVTADLKVAAHALRSQGDVEAAVVTAGSRGAAFDSPQGGGVVPALQVPAADTTAAGDTFVGALIASLADGLDLPIGVAFASAAAALAVTREGAQPSIPNRAEVEQFKARQADA